MPKQPSEYALFIKQHYDEVRSIKGPRERIKELAKRWRERNRQSEAKEAPKGQEPAPKRKKRARKKKE